MVLMVLKDYQWTWMAPHCLGKKTDPGRSGTDNRLFIEAVLYKARKNCLWRDLPEAFGKLNTIFVRFNDWSKAGVFEKIFEAVSGDLDMECAYD